MCRGTPVNRKSFEEMFRHGLAAAVKEGLEVGTVTWEGRHLGPGQGSKVALEWEREQSMHSDGAE